MIRDILKRWWLLLFQFVQNWWVLLQFVIKWWIYNQITLRFFYSFSRDILFFEYIYFGFLLIILIIIQRYWFDVKYYTIFMGLFRLGFPQTKLIYQFVDALQMKLNLLILFGFTPFSFFGHFFYWSSLFPRSMLEYYKKNDLFFQFGVWYYVIIAFIANSILQIVMIYIWKKTYERDTTLILKVALVILTTLSMDDYFFINAGGIIKIIGIVTISIPYFIVSSHTYYVTLKYFKYLQ